MFSSEVASAAAIGKSGLTHRVYIPEAGLRNSNVTGNVTGNVTVVLVHGRAGDCQVPWTFTRALNFDGTRPLVVAPQAPHADVLGGFSWWSIEAPAEFDPDRPRPATTSEQLMPALAGLEKFICSLPELYGAELGKIALVGFSQGAAMVASLSLLRPELFAGVAMLAGFIPKLVYEVGWQQIVPEFTPKKDAKLPRYFISHGRSDKIVPYDRAEKAAHVISNLGAEVTFHLEDVGHKLGTAGMRALGSWFKELLQPGLSNLNEDEFDGGFGRGIE